MKIEHEVFDNGKKIIHVEYTKDELFEREREYNERLAKEREARIAALNENTEETN